MHVDIVGRWEEFEALAPEWNQLLEHSRQNVPFLRHEWLSIWWRNFSRPGDALRVLTVRSPRHVLLAGAPMLLRTERVYGVPCRVLQLMVNSHSCRGGFVMHSACNVEQIVATLWRRLSAQDDWDLVRLRDLADEPEDGVMDALRAVLQQARQRYWIENSLYSPVVPVTDSWEAYQKRLRPKFRRNLRTRTRKLEREVGPIQHDTVSSSGQNLERKLAVGMELEASGWKGQAGSAMALEPAVRRFYRDLANTAAELDWLRLNFLSAGGRPLAFSYGLEYADRFYLLKIGYDERYGRYAPGQLMRQRELADVHERGLRAYEFLGMTAEWKRAWADQERPHRTVTVYRGARSALPYLLTRLRHSRAAQWVKRCWRRRHLTHPAKAD